ncbi:MAG TPA: alpha/beta fold hydrolase [Pirellulales bacterium]|nr:alpha/beta fold hydrolase [Pirellulales bacterium]
MYRLLLTVALGIVVFSPQDASAEWTWFRQTREFASRTAGQIGRCWSTSIDACAATARRWARSSVDYFEPAAQQEAAQRYGLRLPDGLDDAGRLVVLIHGLDSCVEHWQDLTPLIAQEGYAVATFAYPNDQPLDDSAALLAGEIARLRRTHPRLMFDIVGHSMGGIVARAYLEGQSYAGGVERLILLAPPNHGSCYSRFSVFSDFVEHCGLCCTEPDWSWTWMITDGLGEARRDIAPGAAFLVQLNGKARRDNVRYTIVAGNRSCGWRYAANVLRWSTVCVPDAEWSKPWGNKMQGWADVVEARMGSNDGLVEIENALLPGVDDVVIVPADHTTISCSSNGRPPVAWPVIRDRLAR